jgi:hypothetical protein
VGGAVVAAGVGRALGVGVADGECVGRAGCGAVTLGRTVLAILACAGGADEHPLSATATVVATATTIAGATPVTPFARAPSVACDRRSPGHCLVTIPRPPSENV